MSQCNCRTTARKDERSAFGDCAKTASWTNPRYPEGLFCEEHKVAFEWATTEPWELIQ